MSVESSTYTSPILLILIPVGVVNLKHTYLFAMDHRIGSSSVTRIDRETQLPCPVQSILLRVFI